MKITGYQRSNPIKAEHYKKLLQKNLQALINGNIPINWCEKNKEMFRQENLIQLKLPLIA